MKEFLLSFLEFSVSLFGSLEWQTMAALLKVLSIIVSIALFISIVVLIIKIRKNIKKSLEMIMASVETPVLPKKEINKKWDSILEKVESDDMDRNKLAVIEADKILDDLLKRIGYKGEDMGERLKQLTSAQASNINELWQAHKLRNQIVHNPDFELTHSQAKRTIEIYQRAMEDLEAI